MSKYFYVVAALDASTTARAMVMLEAPPADGKYNALKAFLLKLYELLKLEKADHLLSLNGLGDSKPSDLMERIPLHPHLPAPAPGTRAHSTCQFSPLLLQRLPWPSCESRQDFPRQPTAVCPCTASPPANPGPTLNPRGCSRLQ